MKAKISLFFIVIFLIFNAVCGQEVMQEDTIAAALLPPADTLKSPHFPLWTAQLTKDTIVQDTTKIPYLTAEGIRFTDSLVEALKNSFYNLLDKDTVVRMSISHFFVSKPKPFEVFPRKKHDFDLFFVLLFLFSSILAAIRILVPDFFPLFLFKKRKRDLYEKKENVLKNLLHFLLLIASWTGFSVALSEMLSLLQFVFPFHPLLFSFACIFAFFSLKYLLKRIFGWIFRINSLVSEHFPLALNADFFWIFFAFLLLMLNHYVKNDYAIWLVGGIFCLHFLHKLGLEWIIFSKKLAFLENLLYLCSFEILPLLLFARYVTNCV